MILNNFIEERYTDIMTMSKKITKSHVEWEELGHYCIEKFMLHERATELIEANRAMNFISGIMYRSFHSSTSQYHTDIRQKNKFYSVDDWTYLDGTNDEYNLEQDNVLEVIETIIEEMVVESRDQWFRATLFQQWLNNQNYSSLSRQIGIPRTTISRSVEEAITYINRELQNRGINYGL